MGVSASLIWMALGKSDCVIIKDPKFFGLHWLSVEWNLANHHTSCLYSAHSVGI